MPKLLRFLSLLLTATLILSASTTISSSQANSYDIAGIYEKQELKSGSKVIDSYNDVKDAKYVLIPTKIDTDTSKTVSEVSQTAKKYQNVEQMLSKSGPAEKEKIPNRCPTTIWD